MTTRVSAPWCLICTALAAIPAAGCGITVLVEGEAGGARGDTTIGTDTTPGIPPPPADGCTAGCSQPSNGVDTCNCTFECDHFPGNAKAECAPSVDLQGNLKIKCVCTVKDQFTGVCFETNPANLCDLEMGCCGKYLGK